MMGEVHCPKCEETFEKGSRRFCPTDGTRLVSDDGPTETDRSTRGVFAHLLPKIMHDHPYDKIPGDIPKSVAIEQNHLTIDDEPSAQTAEPVFEIDDLEPEFAAETSFAKTIEMSTADLKPIGRKVNPHEIPSGTVDLSDAMRPGAVADFPENDPESFVGRTVKGRYVVTELFEGDDTGYSYLADDKIMADKKVLVRVLFDQGTDEVMGSILDEERVSLSHFSHPNIARVIDSGQFNEGLRFVISEYIDSLSVHDISSIHGQFGALRAARVIRQAAYALGEVHQEGILHRDLRPENIILDTDGEAEQVKLVNFGASNGEPTSENIGYKAPEVLDGRVPTTASDIYSLGVIAYEMLTNRMPFAGTSAKEIMREQNGGLQAQSTNPDLDLSPAVDAVFDKALAYSPVKRYAKSRDFGDAFYNALAENPDRPEIAALETDAKADPEIPLPPVPAMIAGHKPPVLVTLKPIVDPMSAGKNKAPAAVPAVEPAWKLRSPEPPHVENSGTIWFALSGLLVLVALLAFGWYYLVNHPSEPGIPIQTASNQPADQNFAPPITTDIEVPPLPRKINQPPNTEFYQNSKQNLKGELAKHFVGFSMYYPKDWKVNGPQEGSGSNARGKFIDVSRETPDGRPKEQMLVSYYPSEGTYSKDADKFPQLVREANETLKKIVPNYQVLSEGEIKVNGGWRAYEVKFQGGGTRPSGEKIVLWGRRLFIPAARPGVHDGFEITMLATSLAADIRSVDDVGVHGELAAILDSFEPSQNF